MLQLSTFKFLADLADNNHRDWFMDNKPRYEAAKDDVVAFTAAVAALLRKTDSSISADLDPKKCVMRIYRDVRFSTDKAPYKTNFGIGRFTPGNPDSAGYYVHIQPGQSFAGGGSWMPQADKLKAIRQEIDYNGAQLKAIIDAPDFVELFGDFRLQDQLKTTPKGYDANHPDIALLKLKSFVAMQPLTDDDLLRPDAAQKVAHALAHIYPLNEFLNNAIA